MLELCFLLVVLVSRLFINSSNGSIPSIAIGLGVGDFLRRFNSGGLLELDSPRESSFESSESE